MQKVLIVDDDKDILEALNLVLESEGYFVETACNEKETLERVDSFQPDLVLLDVLLSGEDGRTVCRKIKTEDHSVHPKVVLMSAHLSAKENVQEIGADGFLAKPFDITELLEKIQGMPLAF